MTHTKGGTPAKKKGSFGYSLERPLPHFSFLISWLKVVEVDAREKGGNTIRQGTNNAVGGKICQSDEGRNPTESYGACKAQVLVHWGGAVQECPGCFRSVGFISPPSPQACVGNRESREWLFALERYFALVEHDSAAILL